ncbi:MAG TPA: FoF1 ATP synthase subunit gamma [Myxococcota bacterium]|nr:FoF1 ATP synthase subunit gamma [Myxococcota bacterium]
MSRERVLERRLRTLRALDEAVRALRSLSALHFRIARALLPSARAYREEITSLLGALGRPELPEAAAAREPPGVVLVTADFGLVGDYTPRLVREALDLREERGPGPLLCLGRRALASLERAGVRPDRADSAPTSVASLAPRLLPMVDRILVLRSRGELGSLWLVAARFEGAGRFRPTRVPVLPVAPPPGAPALAASPYTGSDRLRTVLVREYLYATLYEVLVDALASEHGKRLVTAESARSWLAERTEATRRLAAAIRREATTQEVIEVATSARAARAEGHGGDGPWTRTS